MRAYVAAGLDPVRFWSLSLRELRVEMAGASDRAKERRSLVWWNAMLPLIDAKDRPSFSAFTGYKPDRRAELRRYNEAWNRIDAALARGRK